MKTIIVPIDFSNEALPGLNFSLMLANKTGANIKMVHVIRKNDGNDNKQFEKERLLAETKFKAIYKKYEEKINLNLSLSYAIKEGKIFEEITNHAKSYEDVLVVLSTHGQSGFNEWFIGGNSYKIASHSKCPLITVRRNPISSTINKIVMPLDITFQTREKVPYTVKLAQTFGSEIHLLSIRLSNFSGIEEKLHKYTTQVASYIEAHNIKCTVEHLQGENLTDMTLEYAYSVNADLISIMTEQEKSVSNLLLGSYAHQMINKALIPVLLFPNYQLQVITEDIWDLGAFNARN
jgi:nucleotide-binding universal stress UspA family protein